MDDSKVGLVFHLCLELVEKFGGVDHSRKASFVHLVQNVASPIQIYWVAANRGVLTSILQVGYDPPLTRLPFLRHDEHRGGRNYLVSLHQDLERNQFVDEVNRRRRHVFIHGPVRVDSRLGRVQEIH